MIARDRAEAFQLFLAILRPKLEQTGAEKLPLDREAVRQCLLKFARIARDVQWEFDFVMRGEVPPIDAEAEEEKP